MLLNYRGLPYVVLITGLFMLQFSTAFSQFDIDYYGKELAYQGDVFSVTSQYYKPIYVEDSITGYELEPYEIVPRSSIAHFNKARQLVVLEEFDTRCGFGGACLKRYNEYDYKDGKLAHVVKHFDGLSRPSTISYRYRNEGDSIFYVYEQHRNYISYKTTTTKRLITKEKHKVSGLILLEVTRLDSMGNSVEYERYYKDKLVESATYTHFKDNEKTRHEALVTNHTKDRTALRVVHYNERGLLSSWEIYNAEGALASKTDFKHVYDDKGNVTEMKIYNRLGKEMYKVVKTYVYRKK